MSISRWKPSTEMMASQDTMNPLFEDSFLWPQGWMAPWDGAKIFLLDIYEDGSNLVVKANLPGIKPEDLDIEIREYVLTISGDIKQEKEYKEDDFHLHERPFGHLQRSVTFPYAVKVDQAVAELEDGILTLTLPKIEVTKGRKILLKTST